MKLSTTFAALFGISAAIVAQAQTTPPDDEIAMIQSLGLKDELPKPGYNMEGGTVFHNYMKAQRDGQFFLFQQGIFHYETSLSEPVDGALLQWCSNLHFTSNSNGTYSRGVGYTAHCLLSFLGDTQSKVEAAGAQITSALTSDEFSSSRSLSASYNTQANMFDITSHNNDDNNVFLFSDSGLPSMPIIAWETHDEGDLSPNADTSSWSGTGKATWVSKEEAANLLNANAADFTPAKFVEIYEKVWNDQHEYIGTGGESTNEEDEEEESTDTDMEEADEDGSNNEESMTAAEDAEEEGSESDAAKEDDESSASNGRRLFVAITSMFSTLLGSSV